MIIMLPPTPGGGGGGSQMLNSAKCLSESHQVHWAQSDVGNREV